MTQQLIILGDSLMDSGNTAGLLSLIGQNPFEDSKYDGGGNTKASDGPVLGELISGVLAVDHRDVVVVLVFLLQLVGQLLSNQIDDMKCFGLIVC